MCFYFSTFGERDTSIPINIHLPTGIPSFLSYINKTYHTLSYLPKSQHYKLTMYLKRETQSKIQEEIDQKSSHSSKSRPFINLTTILKGRKTYRRKWLLLQIWNLKIWWSQSLINNSKKCLPVGGRWWASRVRTLLLYTFL